MYRTLPFAFQLALVFVVGCEDRYLAPVEAEDDGGGRYYGDAYYGGSSSNPYYGDAYYGATTEQTIDCGTDSHDAYKNGTSSDKCIRITFDNGCDSRSSIEVQDEDDRRVGDETDVEAHKKTNIDLEVGPGGSIEVDCGSCDTDDCEGCTYSISSC